MAKDKKQKPLVTFAEKGKHGLCMVLSQKAWECVLNNSLHHSMNMVSPKCFRVIDFIQFFTDNEIQSKEAIQEQYSHDETFAEILTSVFDLSQEQVEAAKARLNDKKGVQFNDLPVLFSQGSRVYINDMGIGAEVRSVNMNESFFGKYVEVNVQFIGQSENGPCFWTKRFNIFNYIGTQSFQKLPIQPLSDEQLHQLTEQNKIVRDIIMKDFHIAEYQGEQTRFHWFGPQHSYVDGRIVVDFRGLKIADSNFDYFYGEYDNDEVVDTIQDEQLWQLNPNMYGFAMKTRTWGLFRYKLMQDAVFTENALDNVKMDSKRRTLVRALVRNHDRHGVMDMVKGKNRGTTFMLHGTPGVGKTLTAEAVAEERRTVLYCVSAGELGIQPREVEDRMTSIAMLMKRWNAILLIDEAEIFLEKRSSENIERNALVCIFLRQLEYFEGIMFMTTNRHDNIDDAIRSRILMDLKYEAISTDDLMSIAEGLLKDVGAKKINLSAIKKLKINGRELRNLIRVAVCLADGATMTQAHFDDAIAYHQDRDVA